MISQAFLYGLYATRAQIDALIAQAEEALGIRRDGVEPGACPNCKASEDKQERADTFGQPTLRCTVCRTEYAPLETVTPV